MFIVAGAAVAGAARRGGPAAARSDTNTAARIARDPTPTSGAVLARRRPRGRSIRGRGCRGVAGSGAGRARGGVVDEAEAGDVGDGLGQLVERARVIVRVEDDRLADPALDHRDEAAAVDAGLDHDRLE